MLYRLAFPKTLLVSALSLLLSAPAAFSDTAPASVSSVQSSANTGAATTSIPIDVPPGRKGIQPNLALTYNSNSPNGWLGVGLSLDMGSIQRSTKRGVSYSANDYIFTWGGGSSELVARGDWGGNYYGAKTEGAFSKYYFDSSTGGWVVTTKDGAKYYYGTTAASRQDSALGVFKWSLDKVVDTNGNYMTVSYWKDQGEIYLDRIDYTGNTGLSPANYVKFYREARTDAPPMYISNFEVRTTYRLKTIEVYGNGLLARKYILNYTYSAGTSRSLLSSVLPYGSDGVTALPTVAVAWPSDNAGGYSSVYLPDGDDDWNAGIMVPGDYNGDGRGDFLSYRNSNLITFLSHGNGTYNKVVSYVGNTGWDSGVMKPGDYNGDGRTDFVSYYSQTQNLSTFFSNGDGTFTKVYMNVASVSWNSNIMRLGDCNGDGRTDFVSYNNGNIITFLSNGDGTYNVTYLNDGDDDWDCGYMLPGDYNGDGKSDFVSYRNGNLVTFFSNGDGTYNKVYMNVSSVNWNSNIMVPGDYNADGRSDFVSYHYGNIITFLSKGDGTFSVAYLSDGDDDWNCSYMLPGDYNGDGRADFVSYRNGNLVSFFSNGDGTYNKVYMDVSSINWNANIMVPADHNGDGKSEFVSYNNGNIVTFFATGAIPDLVFTLSNGLGATTTIAYLPSTSYTNGLLPFVLQAVSSITVNDGNGNVSTTSYAYSGGLYDATEKEFRGFSYVKSTDSSSHTTETWFKQDSVYKGLPYDQIFKSSSGSTYTRSVNTYQSTTPYTGVTFPYLYQRDDYIYDTYTTPKRIYSVFTYDGYGNVTRKDNYGDAAVTGDERYEFTDYTPTSEQATAWLVALPKESYVSTDSAGNNKVSKVTFGYSPDAKGNLLTKTAWLNGGASPVITYTYDAYGNRLTVKDARNYTSTIAYDTITQTFPVTITNALGHSATKTWDYRFGKPLTETDANSNASSYTYDVFGRVVTARGPLDTGSTYGTVTYYYQNFGTVGSQRVTAYRTEQNGTSNAIWEETYFDGLGRTIKSRREGPDNKVIVTDLKYNRRGLMTQRSLPYFEGQTVYKVYLDYDPLGRLVKTTNPDGTVTSQSYNRGRVSLRDANDYKKVEEKDAYGRLVKVEEYKYAGDAAMLWTTTTYQYDAMGNLLKTIDVKGNQTVMAYDTLGRKTAMTDPDMGNWSYGYDANGNLTTQTDAKGQTITFTYDALNRVTKKDYPTGTDAVYTYDEVTSTNGKGRLTTLTDAAGTTKYWFDAMGRTTKSTRTIDGTAYPTETAYDALSRITSVKYPDNETVSYNYDTGGNLSQITGYGTYAGYNALGQAGTITYPNGVTTTYQYIAANSRLYSITTATATQGLMNTSYSYDNVGNILGITDYLDANRNQTFTYDHLNRLTQAVSTAYGTLTYAYSMIGNMTSKEGISYTYPTSGNPRPHAVTSTSDGKTYVYDNNGNMTTDGTRTIAYDYDNMPSSVTMGATTTSFVYDASGQRVKKLTPTATTVYVSKVYECNNGSCTKYIMANGNKLAWKNSNGTYYYHQDHLGSSRVITDASGTKAEEITYLPYGATLTDSGNGTVSVEHRFTSQEYDAETGLYYYGARYYNPALGRFISADSIVPNPADPQAFNRYSYVRNNPLRYTDPTGHSWISKGFRRVINSINKAIDGVLNKLNIEVSDTEVRASYNSNGVTTVSTPSGSVSSGGSAPQTQTERSITACSGGNCVGSGSGSSYETGSTGSQYTGPLYADSRMYPTDAGGGKGGTVTSGGVTYNAQGVPVDEAGIESDPITPLSFIPIMGGIQNVGVSAAKSFWKLGEHKSITKWANQMSKRGWTDQQITEALQVGKKFPAENMVNPANSATRYVHPQTGRSAVIDDVTKEVLHVGGDGFKY